MDRTKIRRPRLFTWYRVLPLAAVLIMGLVAFCYSFAPGLLFKSLYPFSYEEEIVASATRHGVDPYLVAAVIRTESSWDASAVSSKGACGLMQLMPETASDMVAKGFVDGEAYDASNLTDPATNIEFGCAYLSYLITYFKGETDRAIAAYNAGMGNVDQWLGEHTVLHNAITFPETQTYLARVNNARERYRQIYPNAFV
ncbi:lytic transglycosylase domain-containing protein [Collinsella sp. AGMB00827]|uniref:Lytic transglycosylase domain-containing protein n=1 Tax=Collinsella ureilytica TaxID=2869515 RepID=A0ABS7MM00_9ACTN|nr:lytic transglycosylase domain-containing protein [Collinsella urealyticum]MBY4798302.1 lytic transglycosylase domain-containing protein [Collinsella urealyticum]